MKIFNILLLSLGLLLSGNAVAGKMMFGDDDMLHKLQDVSFKGPNGEDLYLAYRTTTKFFILGVNITEQGYVLALKNSEEKSYYPLSDVQIQGLQSVGDLPRILPKYELTIFDYAFGYSLWIFILLSVLYSLIKRQFRKRKDRTESESNVV
ncbi:hypothetical protein [Vibrio sp. 1180_3]|uniref:hypothetical protein n=1 Tax=Vibrio sp. 1180_3 TaxID=2528832 RepID=UPI0024056CC3|nr:hypothetical protein [Vibrio sp. 1180_3]HDY7489123.1 hypothetical protein [Vibrio vulnificus]MDF9401511.1 hypothetical protein [Vibrio sp. 1180_3]HDY8062523.1 hypothetical protein [Vibrio vulnificus]HDY8081575.1 hypothetical protein [Vibrio vulnificus]HDY8192537.1 hypothetical protein [Vibrio vulnificus]